MKILLKISDSVVAILVILIWFELAFFKIKKSSSTSRF